MTTTRDAILGEIRDERERQHAKWGEQNHPDGTGIDKGYGELALHAKATTDWKARHGIVTWADILREEAYEALAEADHGRLRSELIQVAAVCVQWVEVLDRRSTRVIADDVRAAESTTKCGRCDGCGQLADSDAREPWTTWTALPLKSSAAVLMGLVKPIPCDACDGTGQVAAHA